MASGYDISASFSNAGTFGNKFGDMTVGGDRGLRYVSYSVTGLFALGLLFWFLKRK